ncbi:MAG: hypothetical protein IJR39_01655 [Treponema sp.]|nr:hypothetical protein [Treponema sp.]
MGAINLRRGFPRFRFRSIPPLRYGTLARRYNPCAAISYKLVELFFLF